MSGEMQITLRTGAASRFLVLFSNVTCFRNWMSGENQISTRSLLGIVAIVAFGIQANAGEYLRLRSGDVDLTNSSQATNVLSLPHFSAVQDDDQLSYSLGRPAWVGTKERRPSKKADGKTVRHFVVQMNDTIATADLINFKSLKLRIVRYLPDDAVVIASTARAAQVLAKSSNRIRAISLYHPDWKLAPELGASSVFSNDPVVLSSVRLFPDQDVKSILPKLKNTQVKVRSASGSVLVVESKRSMIQPLANLDAVEWIEPISMTEIEASNVNFDPVWVSRTLSSAGDFLPTTVSETFAKFYKNGARVNVGTRSPAAAAGVYDSIMQQTDEFVRDYPDFLILFSGGASVDGTGKEDRIDMNTVSTLGVAKNSLTAGARVADFANQIREYLVTDRKIGEPSAAITKAVLLHTADGLSEGYGRVNMAKATDLASSLLVDERVGLGPNETHLYPITLSRRTQLSATLTYSDVPAASVASKVLVNDLDLAIIDSAGKRWVLGDRNSNSEHLAVNLPAGTYRLEVRGVNVPMAKQTYALVVSAAI